MLRLLLGPEIDFAIVAREPVHLVADTGQIEQVVLNLVVNARDAMPEGGRIVLTIDHIALDDAGAAGFVDGRPGDYARLTVVDTGTGIDEQTRAKLFEPFFTTKAQGKGTGLGLSIVYGIVKQNQGQITVYSQVDCGTIFEIYLPRTKEMVETVHRVKPARLRAGTETILLVDDEDGVRKLCSAVLQSNGYTVIEAGD